MLPVWYEPDKEKRAHGGSCTCRLCLLKQASDEDLGRLEAATVGLLCKADADPSEDLSLDEDDAETLASLYTVYSSTIGAAAMAAADGTLTPEMLKSLQSAAQAQLDEGLALLSESARTRLGPFLDELNKALADMVGGALNPIQAAARLQEALDTAAAAGGTGAYAPWEWARLCRTEAAFAQNEAILQELLDGGADAGIATGSDAIPPIHPSCLCACGALEHRGTMYVVLEPAPTACALCLDVAHEVIDAILAE